MSFVVDVAPSAIRALDRADSGVRTNFQQILDLLEEDPYPTPEFPFIRTFETVGGQTLYLYYDRVFPFVMLHPDDVPPAPP